MRDARMLNVPQKFVDFLESVDPVRVVTPINAREERAKWLRIVNETGEFVNPVFKYDSEYLESLCDWRAAVQSFRNDISDVFDGIVDINKIVLLELLINKLQSTLYVIDLADGILHMNEAKSAEAVIKLYSKATDEDLYAVSRFESLKESGHYDLDDPFPVPFEGSFNANQIVFFFNLVLDKLNLSESWLVEKDPIATAIDVKDAQNRIVVPEDRVVDARQLLALTCHEIGCHVITATNCKTVISKLDKDNDFNVLHDYMAKSYNETLYEASAKWADYRVKGVEGLPYVERVRAIKMAQEGSSFAEIAEHIYNVSKSHSKAWVNALRVTRGRTFAYPAGMSIKSTYAFTKDLAYFRGFDELDQLDPDKFFSDSRYDFGSLDEDVQKLLVLDHIRPMYNVLFTSDPGEVCDIILSGMNVAKSLGVKSGN